MSGITAKVTVDDLEARQALGRLQAGGEDLTPLMDAVGRRLVSGIVERFERGEAPDGTPWTPSRRVQAEGGTTLNLRGHLRTSFTHRPGRDYVDVGSNLVYAAPHHFGATIRAKTSKGLRFKGSGGQWVTKREVRLPLRPILGVSEDDRLGVSDTIADFIDALATGGLE